MTGPSRTTQIAQTASYVAEHELRIAQLARLVVTFALGLAMDSEALASIWASLGAHQVRLRRYPGESDLTLSLWLTRESGRPDVEAQGATLVDATKVAIERLHAWHVKELEEARESLEDLIDPDEERCFGCGGPPGSCAVCAVRTTTEVAASAA